MTGDVNTVPSRGLVRGSKQSEGQVDDVTSSAYDLVAVPIDIAHPRTNHLTTDLPVVGILGVVATRIDSDLVAVPGARAQALLVALALAPGRMRSAQALIDEVWPDEPPRSPKNALQTHISRLRSVLPAGVLESNRGGYQLALDSDDTDLGRARVLTRAAEGRLASSQWQDALDGVLDA